MSIIVSGLLAVGFVVYSFITKKHSGLTPNELLQHTVAFALGSVLTLIHCYSYFFGNMGKISKTVEEVQPTEVK